MRYLLLALLLLAACTPNNAPTPAYPCGARGHVCASGGCCSLDEVCGGDDPTCPDDDGA